MKNHYVDVLPPNRYLFYLFFYILRFTQSQSTMSSCTQRASFKYIQN